MLEPYGEVRQEFSWAANFIVVLDNGRSVETGPDFGSHGGSGTLFMDGHWDIPEADWEDLDAAYRTRPADIEASMRRWLVEPIWEDGTSAAIRDLRDTLRRESIEVTAEALTALPVTFEIESALSHQLWHGTHPALKRCREMSPDDPRINP